MPIEITYDLARSISSALDVRSFQRASGDAKGNAQSNLAGRTHYVDDATLRDFRSRINSSRDVFNGTVFLIVESVSGDYQHKSRGFRFVAFDLAGTVINDRLPADAERLHRTSAKAEAEMWAWVETFDAAAHYVGVLRKRADRAEQSAKDMREAALVLA